MNIRAQLFSTIATITGQPWTQNRIKLLDDCLDALGVPGNKKTIDDDPASSSSAFQTPSEFCEDTLMAHEGGLSMDRNDRGNWYKGVLVGSKYGVTAAALASYRRVRSITPAQMKALTKAEAIQVALSDYFVGPKIDELEWNAVTASILDMGYNAGPGTAIKLAQRMIGVSGDGRIGQFTDRAYSEFVAEHGIETTARKYAMERIDYYERIIKRRPKNAKYRNGWTNRAKSFLPGTKWWNKFHKAE